MILFFKVRYKKSHLFNLFENSILRKLYSSTEKMELMAAKALCEIEDTSWGVGVLFN